MKCFIYAMRYRILNDTYSPWVGCTLRSPWRGPQSQHSRSGPVRSNTRVNGGRGSPFTANCAPAVPHLPEEGTYGARLRFIPALRMHWNDLDELELQ